MKIASHTTFAFDPDLDTVQKMKAVGEVVTEFVKKNGLGKPEIHLAIPRDQVIVRDVRLPLVVKENLRTTLSYELQKYIPLAADKVYFDYLINDENRQDQTIRILLFVIKRTDLDDYLALSSFIGYPLSGIQIQATALCGIMPNTLLEDDARRIGVIHLDAISCQIHIFREGNLLQTKLIGPSTSREGLITAIREWTQTTGLSRTQSTDPISWYYHPESHADISQDQLKKAISLETVPLNFSQVPLPQENLLFAYALATQGARSQPAVINLVPLNLRRKPSRVAYYMFVALVLLTIVSGIGWGGSILLRQKLSMGKIESQLAALQSQVGKVDQLASQISKIEQQIQDIQLLKNSRILTLQVLNELSSRIPTDTWIEELRMAPDGLQINGYSDSASELLAILEDSPLFKDVTFSAAITKNNEGKDRFRLGLTFQ